MPSGRDEVRDRCGGTVYVRRELLGPRQIRNAHFRWTRLGRRGLDPAEVRSFLTRVAVEVADLQAEVIRVREESGRIKDAMRRWQSRQALRVNERWWPAGRGCCRRPIRGR